MVAVSMASIAAEPKRIGKENIHYIYTITVGLFIAQLVCEGLSRRTARAGAEVARVAAVAAPAMEQ